jgi:hypothetical protein
VNKVKKKGLEGVLFEAGFYTDGRLQNVTFFGGQGNIALIYSAHLIG